MYNTHRLTHYVLYTLRKNMRHETSSSLQMHNAVVEKVYDSGIIDARSMRGRRFNYVNSIVNGVEFDLKEGDRCVILSDGAQHIVFGQIRNIETDNNGNKTIKKAIPDLFDMQDAKVLEASDHLENQSKVVASPAAGILLDAGEGVITHLDPSQSSIRNFSERCETVTVPHYSEVDHRDGTCESNYKWRTEVDFESMDRDLLREQDDSKDKGNTLTISIKEGEKLLDLLTRKNGNIQASISISEDGDLSIEVEGETEILSAGSVTLESDNSIDVKSPGAEINMSGTPGLGGLALKGGGGVELISQLQSLVNQLPTCTTITPLGTFPLIAAPLQAQLIPLILQIKGEFQ